MISCTLNVQEDVDDLYSLFEAENLESSRAKCTIIKEKSLVFKITADDPVSMRAFISSILKIIETYNKSKAVK